MPLLKKLQQYISVRLSSRKKETDPVKAYDLWAPDYDHQPDNLMLVLDKQLFTRLTTGINFKGDIIADVGCGTGRHWQKILDMQPRALLGFDVSRGMLAILERKFPGARTCLITGNDLPGLADDSCDVVMSTLALAHIENIAGSMAEWNRVLKPGGQIIITDYHPDALERGGNRTFRHDKQTIAVKNHIHPLQLIHNIAAGLHWEVLQFTEEIINEEVKHYYEKQQAVSVYEQFRGVPIIYGMRLIKKVNDT